MSTFTPKDLERAWGLCSDDGWYDNISPERVAQAFADIREECAKEVERYPIHDGFDLRTAEAIERRDMAMAVRIRELGK